MHPGTEHGQLPSRARIHALGQNQHCTVCLAVLCQSMITLVSTLLLTWVAAAGAVDGDWALHKMTAAATKTGAVCLVRVR